MKKCKNCHNLEVCELYGKSYALSTFCSPGDPNHPPKITMVNPPLGKILPDGATQHKTSPDEFLERLTKQISESSNIPIEKLLEPYKSTVYSRFCEQRAERERLRKIHEANSLKFMTEIAKIVLVPVEVLTATTSVEWKDPLRKYHKRALKKMKWEIYKLTHPQSPFQTSLPVKRNGKTFSLRGER